MRPLAAELVRLNPDVIFASATTSLVALQQATRTVPIVFAQVTDPVGAGFVASLARPGGNITGVTQHEFTIGVKWLDCSSSSRQTSPVFPSSTIPATPPRPDICTRSSLPPRRSASPCPPLPCATRPRLRAPLMVSQPSRTAA